MNCFRRASIGASAALSAHSRIDLVDVSFGNSANGAFVNTSSACNAIIANNVSHSCQKFMEDVLRGY